MKSKVFNIILEYVMDNLVLLRAFDLVFCKFSHLSVSHVQELIQFIIMLAKHHSPIESTLCNDCFRLWKQVKEFQEDILGHT